MLNVTRIGAIGNIVTGAWLMLSALLFRDSPAHAINTLVVGAAAVGFALVAMRRSPLFEAGNIVLAAWLFASPIAIPGGTAALVINHLIVATLLFGFAAPVMAALDEIEDARRERGAITPRRAHASRAPSPAR